jgi:serine/threonine-protein kinase HipA
MVNSAKVYLWNTYVGSVLWDEINKVSAFEYTPSFQEKGWNISPIVMPVRKGVPYS